MKYTNVETLRKALVGKTILGIDVHGGHGMVLTITTIDQYGKEFQKMDICSYEDEISSADGDFYVALNDQEL